MTITTNRKETEIGMIPQEWEVLKLGEICKINVWFVWTVSDSLSSKELWVPMITTKNIVDWKISLSDVYYVTKEFHEKNKKSSLWLWDLVIARHWDNDNGKTAKSII